MFKCTKYYLINITAIIATTNPISLDWVDDKGHLRVEYKHLEQEIIKAEKKQLQV